MPLLGHVDNYVDNVDKHIKILELKEPRMDKVAL
jgi:hypothetical protein